MIVSQVARFVHTPKGLHELALIAIGRNFKGIADRGLISKSKDVILLKTDVIVEAEFACGWGVEYSTNPDCVKSCI